MTRPRPATMPPHIWEAQHRELEAEILTLLAGLSDGRGLGKIQIWQSLPGRELTKTEVSQAVDRLTFRGDLRQTGQGVSKNSFRYHLNLNRD